jgi:tungstate transport system substrate-binding protein
MPAGSPAILLTASIALLAACGGQPAPAQTACPPLESRQRLLVATTTSLYDTGFWACMEPLFEEQFGVELDILCAGTGRALELGAAGDVDVVVVHDRAREEQFVADGHGLSRTPFACSYFVLVGPPGDPSGLAGMTPEAALAKLYRDASTPFISRGDGSGTHAREQMIWAAAGLDYGTVRTSGDWYVEAAAGMGTTLNLADETRAYALCDIATFLAYQGDVDLEIIVDEGRIMQNVYAVIPLTAARDPEMARNMVAFLTSPAIQDLIGSFGVDECGRQLFTPCAGQDL